MQQAIVRLARSSDAAGLVQLLTELGYPGTENFIRDRVAQLRAHRDAILLVAECDDGIAGVISLHIVPQLALAGDFCRISYLCVGERFRGAGIGERLEKAAIAEARMRGCDRVELHCHERRVDAHRFYARQGYVESPRYLMKELPRG